MNTQQWNMKQAEEKRITGVRMNILIFCTALILLAISGLIWNKFHMESAVLGEDRDNIPLRFQEIPMASVPVPGVDYPTNLDNSSVQVVEKGASFRMMPSSTNQPRPVSEEEVLERQERARNSQRNAEAMKARGVK